MVAIGDIDIIGVDIDTLRFRRLTDINDLVRCRMLLAEPLDRPLNRLPPHVVQAPASGQQGGRVGA